MDDHSKTFSYIDHEGTKIGPVELDSIIEKIEKGELDEEVSIHPKGSKCWVSYKQYMKISQRAEAAEVKVLACNLTSFSAVRFCSNIVLVFLVICLALCFIWNSIFSLLWGGSIFMLWLMARALIKDLLIASTDRDQRIIDAISKLSKTGKASQMILERQLKRIEELERQLGSLTQGK